LLPLDIGVAENSLYLVTLLRPAKLRSNLAAKLGHSPDGCGSRRSATAAAWAWLDAVTRSSIDACAVTVPRNRTAAFEMAGGVV
jgi:hypothetical protein